MYKVGDKVVVRKKLDLDRRYKMDGNILSDVVTPEMLRFCGEVVTISKVDRKYKIEGCPYWWTDEMFEGYVDEDEDFIEISDSEFESLFSDLMYR